MLETARSRVDGDIYRDMAEMLTMAHALKKYADAGRREMNELATKALVFIFERMKSLDADPRASDKGIDG